VRRDKRHGSEALEQRSYSGSRLVFGWLRIVACCRCFACLYLLCLLWWLGRAEGTKDTEKKPGSLFSFLFLSFPFLPSLLVRGLRKRRSIVRSPSASRSAIVLAFSCLPPSSLSRDSTAKKAKAPHSSKIQKVATSSYFVPYPPEQQQRQRRQQRQQKKVRSVLVVASYGAKLLLAVRG